MPADPRARCRLFGLGPALILALLAAACQPVPRPFQSEAKPQALATILKPGPYSGVFIESMTDTPQALEASFKEKLAQALRERDIPASLQSSNQGTLFISCRALIREEPDGAFSDLALYWKLKNAQGAVVDAFKQEARVRTLEWAGASPALIEGLSRDAAEGIVRRLTASEERPAGTSLAGGPTGPRLVVLPVDGAPGDGRESLTGAMRDSLRRAAVDLDSEIDERTLVLLGSVHVGDAARGTQQVDVVWTLIGPDGKEFGTVKQSGEVPAGALAGPWGSLAQTVAERGAAGVLALLERAQASD